MDRKNRRNSRWQCIVVVEEKEENETEGTVLLCCLKAIENFA